MGTLIENLSQIESIKGEIRSAIESKGVDMTNVSFPDYPGAIASISTAFVTETLSVTVNGTYYPSVGVDGFSEVSVNVPAPSPVTQPLNVSVNGTYYPGLGYDGFSEVSVDVPQTVIGYTEKDITEGNFTSNLNNSASFVPSYAFDFDRKIQTVNLPNCVYVGSSAFYYASLISASLPVCTTLYMGAFSGAVRLSNIYLPECSSIYAGALRGTALSNIDLPKVKSIQTSAFQGCGQLVSVSIPICEYIGQNAFRQCSLLQSIVLPMVSSIDVFAFSGCTGLSQITLGYSSVCSLFGTAAFIGTPISSGTGSIYVPSSLVSDYKSASGWAVFESQIFSIPE